MSMIVLKSKADTDASHIKNYFKGGIFVEPNSEIALVSADLNFNPVLSITAENNTFQVVYGSSTYNPTIAGGSYTNGLTGSIKVGIEANVTTAGGGADDYIVGDATLTGGTGENATCRITAVDGNGGIERTEYTFGGQNYTAADILTVTQGTAVDGRLTLRATDVNIPTQLAGAIRDQVNSVSNQNGTVKLFDWDAEYDAGNNAYSFRCSFNPPPQGLTQPTFQASPFITTSAVQTASNGLKVGNSWTDNGWANGDDYPLCPYAVGNTGIANWNSWYGWVEFSILSSAKESAFGISTRIPTLTAVHTHLNHYFQVAAGGIVYCYEKTFGGVVSTIGQIQAADWTDVNTGGTVNCSAFRILLPLHQESAAAGFNQVKYQFKQNKSTDDWADIPPEATAERIEVIAGAKYWCMGAVFNLFDAAVPNGIREESQTNYPSTSNVTEVNHVRFDAMVSNGIGNTIGITYPAQTNSLIEDTNLRFESNKDPLTSFGHNPSLLFQIPSFAIRSYSGNNASTQQAIARWIKYDEMTADQDERSGLHHFVPYNMIYFDCNNRELLNLNQIECRITNLDGSDVGDLLKHPSVITLCLKPRVR